MVASGLPSTPVDASVEDRWYQLRNTVQVTAFAVRRANRQHREWFEDNDAAISNLLAEKNRRHKAYVNCLVDDNKTAFYRSGRLVQQRLREIQETWTARKSEEIQEYPDRNEWENFFSVLKAGCVSTAKGTDPLLNADGTTLLTEKTQALQRWARDFRRPQPSSQHLEQRHCPFVSSEDQDRPRHRGLPTPNYHGCAPALRREGARIGRDPC
nr:unnamed protein product [Spirometra erinaceieuropaei]